MNTLNLIKSKKGGAIILFLITSVVFIAVIANLMVQAISEKNSALQGAAANSTNYLVTAAMTKVNKAIADQLRNYEDPTAGPFPAAITLFTQVPDSNIQVNYDVTAYQQDPACDPQQQACAVRQWNAANADGTTSQCKLYQTHVTAWDNRYPQVKGEGWAAIDACANSIYQFAYMNDWGLAANVSTGYIQAGDVAGEIVTVGEISAGRLHVNNDMYLDYQSFYPGYLKLSGLRITASGYFFNRLSPENQEPQEGDGRGVLIRNSAVTDPLASNYYVEVYDKANGIVYDHTVDSDSQSPPVHVWDSATIQSRWNGVLKDGSMGVKPVNIADRDVLFSYLKQKAESGGLKIYCSSDCSAATDFHAVRSGADITQQLVVDNNVITTSSFWNPKEDANINVVQVDLKQLRDLGLMPADNLMYVERSDADSGNGLRLINGEKLNNPLTVAMKGVVFIKGDFNVGADDDGLHTTPANSENDVVNVKPAAVIAESLYFQSYAWLDRLNQVRLSSRKANAGTDHLMQWNLAEIVGYQPDEVGAANGAEGGGYVMENWYGSAVTGYIQTKFVGSRSRPYPVWISVSDKYGPNYEDNPIYKAWTEPWRATFLYDTGRFDNVSTLPPFAPVYYTIKEHGFKTKIQ